MDEIFYGHQILQNNYGNGGITKAFNCPFCSGFAAHEWTYSLRHQIEAQTSLTNAVILATCQACTQSSIWLKNEYPSYELNDFNEMLLYPRTSTYSEKPNSDMPIKVKEVFNEALLILDDSPRASAALARLAIDILTNELGAEGKTLNHRIGALVSMGLPVTIQKALDSIRVIGNNAVHPGEITMSDNKDDAISLLKFINIIVDNQITQPKLINEAYSSLPKGALEAIEKRDKKD